MLTYDYEVRDKKSELGRLLKYYKLLKNLTFAEISEKSQVPESTIKKIMSGYSKNPKVRTVQMIMKAMDLENVLKAEADENGNIKWQLTGDSPFYNYGTEAVDLARLDEEIFYETEQLEKKKKTSKIEIIPDGGRVRFDDGPYTLKDYYDLPDERRVELINGHFYDMGAPTTVHQHIAFQIGYQFQNYISKNKGRCTVFVAPVDVQLDCDDKTMVEPDVLVLCDMSKNINRCIYGAPDFLTEVLSPSSKNKDEKLKWEKYRDAGVREYWIVDPKKRTVEAYFFEGSDDIKEYTFDDEVPVGIYGGGLKVDFKEIQAGMESWGG